MTKLHGWIPGEGHVEVDVPAKELKKADAELVRAAQSLQRALQQKETTQ